MYHAALGALAVADIMAMMSERQGRFAAILKLVSHANFEGVFRDLQNVVANDET